MEVIIDDINYRLYPETKTAEIASKSDGYSGEIIIPSYIVFKDTTYVVKKGDTLYGISTSYGVSVDDIKSLKKLKMIVLAGVCGDLCVMDFGRTLLRYLDEINHDLKVFVVKSCIDTFDAPGHNREELLDIAYKVLEQAGAVVVENVDDLKGKVIDCVMAGYTLNEKVVRHAKVAVGQ